MCSDHATTDEEEPNCRCHPAYHELGVHGPGWTRRADDAAAHVTSQAQPGRL